MSEECWTNRYNGRRLPPPLQLKPPLALGWKYESGGMGQGFVRAGDDAVFSEVGQGVPLRLDLRTGNVVWKGQRIAALFIRWRTDLVVFDDDGWVRFVDIRSGAERESRFFEPGLGLYGSYVAGDVLVGSIGGKFHAVDLAELRQLWTVPELITNPLTGDEDRVIRAQDDVTCFDLRMGKVLWHRPGTDFGGDAYRPGCIWEGRFVCILGGQLTALDLETGATLWRWKLPSALHWWEPYGGHAYCFFDGVYRIVDLRNGELLLERSLGPYVPEPVRRKKAGLTVGTRGRELADWRDVRVAVSETHAFLTNASGQIVALKRDTGEVEQVVEIDAMPVARTAPVIYENRLLLTGFDAAVYCLEGATGE